jgi:tripartite-type tricarboxylate transporter receptor subunit TctC
MLSMTEIVMKKILIAAAVALAAASAPALAQYPDQPIKLVVAWPGGGVSDVLGRYMADKLGPVLKQPVVVDNRPGANGLIGTQAVAKAAPNGYTLQVITAESHAINPHVYKKLGYDPKTAFEPIAMVGKVYQVLATRADLPAKNVPELIAAAKANPSGMHAGHYGVGSTSQLGMALFEKTAGVQFNQVPYKGVTPTVNALLAGEVDVAMANAFNVVQFMKTGRLRVIGSASPKPLASMPDVPTIESQGLKGFYTGNWYGFVAPKGTPPAIINFLAAEIKKIADTPEFKERLATMGIMEEFMGPEESRKFLAAENDVYARIVKERNISID